MKALYLQHDSNTRQDEKIGPLLSRYGNWGYGVWWSINELLRISDCYRLPYTDDEITDLAFYLHEDEVLDVKELIDFCIERGLYEKKDGYFWSDRCQRDAAWSDRKHEQTKEAGRARARQMLSTRANAPPDAAAQEEKIIQDKKTKDKKNSGASEYVATLCEAIQKAGYMPTAMQFERDIIPLARDFEAAGKPLEWIADAATETVAKKAGHHNYMLNILRRWLAQGRNGEQNGTGTVAGDGDAIEKLRQAGQQRAGSKG